MTNNFFLNPEISVKHQTTRSALLCFFTNSKNQTVFLFKYICIVAEICAHRFDLRLFFQYQPYRWFLLFLI